MGSIAQLLERYTSKELYGNRALQGVVFVAKDKNGNVLQSATSGLANFPAEGEASKPIQTDSTAWLASMTKMITAISALQLVDKGLLNLDEDLGKIVPELEDRDVFNGLDADGKPILKKQTKALTMRHLLTHTSGLAYDFISPVLQQWMASAKLDALPGVHTSMEQLTHPLIFQPGEGWEYGNGIDWAGHAIEIITGQTLEDYMQEHIFSVLDMKYTTFHPKAETNAHISERQIECGFRSPDGSLVRGFVPVAMPSPLCTGGAGLFSNADDYIKVLVELLSGGSKLLSPASTQLIFEPQLEDLAAKQMLVSLNHTKEVTNTLRPSWPDDVKGSFSLAGTVNLEDIPGRRREGTLNWTGVSNVHWWIDRKAGVCATFFTQILPPGDTVVLELLEKIEEQLYAGL